MYETLEESQSCYASMDLVPRPSSGKPGISYIVKQIAKIGKRMAEGDTAVYEDYRAQVDRSYKSKSSSHLWAFDMRRFLLAMSCLLIFSGCATRSDVEASYSGLNFHIPSNVVAVGSAGGDDNFLGFKYSTKPGEQFIAFTKEGSFGTGGCDYPSFFRQVLKLEDSGACDISAVESFRKVFDVSDASGVWQAGQHDAYYFPADDGKIFVFLVLDGRTVVKIDSDFLDEKGMKAVLSDQLPP
ncbi:hypothetical protein [Marinobacter nanhaiticus]|uniref:hypothetical protein n=1 Tax=Marinobacter nanhaiticus TaxID=1305740 RepID=UPI0003A45079|nr:hypothetical protein [Marinobacter nanhaiticus]